MSLIYAFRIAAVIIGAILGAGFLSGKELYSFFGGFNIYITLIGVFIVFFLLILFFLRFKIEEKSVFYKLLICLFYIGNFIVMCSMLSAVDALLGDICNIPKSFPLFSLLTLILSNAVMLFGMRGLKAVNLVLVPVMIFVIVFLVYIPSDKIITTEWKFKIFNLLEYCGFNVLLIVPLLIKIGRCENMKVCFLAALISSLVVTFLVFLIISVLNSAKVQFLESDLPLLQILSNKKSIYITYIFVLYFGIFTTLISAHYPLFELFKDDFKGNLGKIILSVVCLTCSRIGFSNIVNQIYPIIGIIAFVLLFICVLSKLFSQKKPQ